MTAVMVWGVWLGLLACGDKDGSGDGQGDGGAVSQDRDGDGYPADRDCDDSNPAVHPDAAEVCDGWDNDCNGATDEEDPGLDLSTARTCYEDNDQDGWGDAARVHTVCAICSDPDMRLAEQAGDCDDQDAAVHPEATERCDLLDNDCDGTTDGEGLTTFFPEDPNSEITTWDTRTSFFDIFVEEPGELLLCGGTHRMRVVAEMYSERPKFTIRGIGPGATIDAEGNGSAVQLKRISAVKFEDITLTAGWGDGLSGANAGGGIACEDVESVEYYRGSIADNHAEVGGGIASEGCNIYLEDVNLERNEATNEGGAIWWGQYKSELSLFQVNVHQNHAQNGGGIYLDRGGSADGEATRAELTSCSFQDNTSEEGGGAITVVSSDLWMGGEGSELRGNSSGSGAGAVWIAGLARGQAVSFDSVDFGEANDEDKNGQPELWVLDAGMPYAVNGLGSFTCTASGCGTSTTVTIGSPEATAQLSRYMWGDIVEAHSLATIDAYQVHMVPLYGICTADMYILSTDTDPFTTSASTWTVEWADTSHTVSGSGWISGNGVSVLTIPGRWYAFVVGGGRCGYADLFSLSYATPSGTDLGFGYHVGNAAYTYSSVLSVGGTASLYAGTGWYSFAQRLGVTTL